MSDQAKTTHKNHPWEDTLILAFRDIQWMRHSQKQLAFIKQAFDDLLEQNNVLKKSPDDRTLRAERNATGARFKSLLLPDAMTPPLLAKLDGNAESAAGDVITAHEGRFFLIEFKSTLGDRNTERDKFLGVFMCSLHPQKDHPLIELSRTGHFFISQRKASPTKPPEHVRFIKIEARTYYDVLKQPKLNTVLPVDVHELLNNAEYGLPLAEMADYLRLLCGIHDAGATDGGYPLKVAIANDAGEFWPVADLSDLAALSDYFKAKVDKTYQSGAIFSTENIARLKDQYKNALQLDIDLKLLTKKAAQNKNRADNKFKPPTYD